MKHKISLILLCLILSATSFAQTEKMTREDKDEKNTARTTRIKDKTDYTLFHRQMLSLKEYGDERKKIPAIQKANKMPVKIVAVVDTTIDDETSSKILIGYITQVMGDNTNNVYEVTFDRAQQKISGVKRLAEPEETETPEKTTAKKPIPNKTTVHKKKGDDDDDDDDDADTGKPSKKDKDDDKE